MHVTLQVKTDSQRSTIQWTAPGAVNTKAELNACFRGSAQLASYLAARHLIMQWIIVEPPVVRHTCVWMHVTDQVQRVWMQSWLTCVRECAKQVAAAAVLDGRPDTADGSVKGGFIVRGRVLGRHGSNCIAREHTTDGPQPPKRWRDQPGESFLTPQNGHGCPVPAKPVDVSVF